MRRLMLLSITYILISSICLAQEQNILDPLVNHHITAGTFSGAQVSVLIKGNIVFSNSYGTLTSQKTESVEYDTCFDLASLTKPLATLPMIVWLIYKGRVNPDEKVSFYFPSFANKNTTVRSLIDHTSGLPAYDDFFKKFNSTQPYQDRKEELVQYIGMLEEKNPGQMRYSDINYILLGFLIEDRYNLELDDAFSVFLQEIGYSAQSLPSFSQNAKKKCLSFAATRVSPTRGRVNVGTVEDENAFFLDGHSGHAGLFSSAETAGQYLSFLIQQEWFRPYVIEGTGFDTPDTEDSSYGSTASPSLRGHLGYSGTAFLVDPACDCIILVFTNRTHMNEDRKSLRDIKKFRQQVFETARLRYAPYPQRPPVPFLFTGTTQRGGNTRMISR